MDKLLSCIFFVLLFVTICKTGLGFDFLRLLTFPFLLVSVIIFKLFLCFGTLKKISCLDWLISLLESANLDEINDKFCPLDFISFVLLFWYLFGFSAIKEKHKAVWLSPAWNKVVVLYFFFFLLAIKHSSKADDWLSILTILLILVLFSI